MVPTTASTAAAADALSQFQLIGVIAGGVLVGVALIVCVTCSIVCGRRDRRKDLVDAAGTRNKSAFVHQPVSTTAFVHQRVSTTPPGSHDPHARVGAVERVLATQDLLVPPYDRVPSEMASAAPLQRQDTGGGGYAHVVLPPNVGYVDVSVNRSPSDGDAYNLVEVRDPYTKAPVRPTAGGVYGGASVLVQENYGGAGVLARSNEHSAHYTELRSQPQSDASLPTLDL